MPGDKPDNLEQFLGVPERLAELVLRYYDGNLSEEETTELRERLKQSAAARDWFVQLGVQSQSLAEVLAPQYSEEDEPISFEQLAAMEDRAHAELVDLQKRVVQSTATAPAAEEDLAGLSAHDMMAVGGYVLRKALKSKAAVYAYAAAVVLLAAVLFNPWGGNETPTRTLIAEDSSEPDPLGVAPVVATLTAVHDAQWLEGALASGSPLQAGDRLTLTQGFAEITTNRGAIATIQAPATIELIEHDNAIRLHTGKLVGLCRTESSKGFVVKTRYADIVDLGTEFGVELQRNRMTTTVFTGEVEVAAHGGTPRSVTTNQSAKLKIDGNSRSFVVDDQLAKGFDKVHAVALTKTTTLPGTGRATAVGQADPYWSIAAIDGLALLKPVAATVADPTSFTTPKRENVRFMPNDSASKWITPLPHYKPSESVEYQTTFDASGFDLDTLSLELRLLADKHVTEIELNGQPVDVPTQGIGPAFTEMTELTLREGFMAGLNTLNITAQRHRTVEHAGFWTGLRAELQLTSQRPSVGPNE